MKTVSRLAFALLLLCLLLSLTVPAAFAEGSSQTKQAGRNVVVGFEPLEDEGVIRVDHKYALVTLEKRFPAELDVWLGGSVTYEAGSAAPVGAEGYTVRSVKVTWKCLDNYDGNLNSFRFVPVLKDLKLAEGLELPQLTVVVEESFTPPPPGVIPDVKALKVPIIGSIVGNDSSGSGSALPAYYNSYENGALPPVRDQNPYGTCWAFATLGSIEADLIHDGAAGTDIDLSELHLAYSAYHPFYDEKGGNEGDSVTSSGLDHLDGGRPDVAASVLANLVGGASEAEVPYEWAENYFPSAYAGRAYAAPLLTGAYCINTNDTGSMKAAIMAHGGISALINMDASLYYSAAFNSYYSTDYPINHAVMLVGWDDSFPKEHFRDDQEKPSADGAWLVRNSWGVDEYDSCGYFWLSYEDAGLHSDHAVAFDAQSESYPHCYAYDTCYFPYSLHEFVGPVTESQVFTVAGGERIAAVSFRTDTALLDVELSLSCGAETVTASTFAALPGIHLVQLETPLDIPVTSEVTLSVTFSGQDTIRLNTEGVGHLDWGQFRYNAACGGGGLVVSNTAGEYHLGEDGHLKLYTEDYDASVDVNMVNFPNPVFRAYVAAKIDTDHDTILSAEEIAAVKAIDFSGGDVYPEEEVTAAEAPARTLKGLEFFPALESLSCDYAMLEGLDLSRNRALKSLSCTHNLMTSLDLSPCPALAALLGPECISVDGDALLFRDEETGASLRIDPVVKLTPALQLGSGVSIADRFPDEHFRAWVVKNSDIDGDGTLTDFERSVVTKIRIPGGIAGPVASLEGIELFSALRVLDCSSNSLLTSLDVSALTGLENLNCSGCALESLTLGDCPALTVLNCNENRLSALDVSGCEVLEELYCRDNQLESVDLSGCTVLWDFSCRNNRLTELDLHDCAAIRSLYCNNNRMASLDLSGCPAMLWLLEEAELEETAEYACLYAENLYTQFDKDLTLIPCLPDLILPEELTEIGEEAFAGGAFVHASLSGNTEIIAKNAFAGCPKLRYVYIPHDVAMIDPQAFGTRADLTIIGWPGSTAETFAEEHGFTFLAVSR